MAIVLALVGGTYWVVRRWMPSMRAADTGVLRVVGRTSLGPKHQVVLVQLGRRLVAVGVSGDRLATLCEITDPDEVAMLVARSGARSDAGFNEELFREASTFEEPIGELTGELRSAPPCGARESKPVRDLLHKLRTLRSN